MADDTITDPPVAGDPNADPISSGSPPKPAPIYTKEELTRITSREVGKVAADRDALAAKLAEYEKREAAEAEAKLSKEQRATLERKREIEAYEAKVNALTQQAATERTKRHEVLRAGKAASLASTLAAQVANPGLLPHVERSIAERLVVEVGEDGAERVVIQLGAPGDVEPLETGFAKFRDAQLTAFLKVASGSGAQHGAGAAGGRATFAHLSPTDKMIVGLNAKQR